MRDETFTIATHRNQKSTVPKPYDALKQIDPNISVIGDKDRDVVIVSAPSKEVFERLKAEWGDAYRVERTNPHHTSTGATLG